jgi:hypothetical protein
MIAHGEEGFVDAILGDLLQSIKVSLGLPGID